MSKAQSSGTKNYTSTIIIANSYEYINNMGVILIDVLVYSPLSVIKQIVQTNVEPIMFLM